MNVPNKTKYAREYLLDHPALLAHTGRSLERTINAPVGKITYRTWNESKNAVFAALSDPVQYEQVDINLIAGTVTAPNGVITPLTRFKWLTVNRLLAFYDARGWLLYENTPKRIRMAKRADKLEPAERIAA